MPARFLSDMLNPSKVNNFWHLYIGATTDRRSFSCPFKVLVKTFPAVGNCRTISGRDQRACSVHLPTLVQQWCIASVVQSHARTKSLVFLPSEAMAGPDDLDPQEVNRVFALLEQGTSGSFWDHVDENVDWTVKVAAV